MSTVPGMGRWKIILVALVCAGLIGGLVTIQHLHKTAAGYSFSPLPPDRGTARLEYDLRFESREAPTCVVRQGTKVPYALYTGSDTLQTLAVTLPSDMCPTVPVRTFLVWVGKQVEEGPQSERDSAGRFLITRTLRPLSFGTPMRTQCPIPSHTLVMLQNPGKNTTGPMRIFLQTGVCPAADGMPHITHWDALEESTHTDAPADANSSAGSPSS